MIKFALCDDNTQLLCKLKEILEKIFLKHDWSAEVTFVSDNADDLLNFISTNDVDALFLDIDLNSKSNGIDLAKKIRKRNKSVYIIFLTGHFEYIVSAFECNTFDYIPKPVNRAKLEKTLCRLFEDINGSPTKFISLKNSHELINQNLVNYIQKDGMRAIYSTETGSISSYGSFNSISQTLPKNFVRCHKSFIVNIDNISNVDFKSNTISFKNSSDATCYIGPKYKNNFMEVLNNYGNIK